MRSQPSTHPPSPRLRYIRSHQSQYAASLLYPISLYFSKISLSCFIRNLTPKAKDHLIAYVVQISVTILALVSFLGTAFQCNLPQTWDYYTGKCMNLVLTPHPPTTTIPTGNLT